MSAVFGFRCELKPIPPAPFADYHVEQFISDFAKLDGDALMDLEDLGCRFEVGCADLFRALCQTWVSDKNKVYEVAGTHFWQLAKACAYEVYRSELND